MARTGQGGGTGRHAEGTRQLASSYDVARLAGVSQSAVSRAFRPGAYVSEVTRAKVLAAAGALGFRPNAIARGLATRRSGIIAVAMQTIGNPVYPAVLDAFGRRFQAEGRQLLLLTDLADPAEAMLRILQYQTDAVIVTAASLLEPSRGVTQRCLASGVPVVLFNRVFADLPVPAVVCANRAGGRLAADLLVRAGHRRLAFIGGPEETSTVVDRREGFAAATAALGAPPPLVESGAYSYEAGRSALLRVMRRPDPPDAVFCTNDLLALGAMDAARVELGLRVPEDLSVIGFDDVPMADWTSYRLTTIRPRFEAMVDAAATLALELPGSVPPRAPIEIPADLVARASARLPD